MNNMLLQVKGLLGLKIVHKCGLRNFLGIWIDIVRNIASVRLADALLGSACIIFLMSLRVRQKGSS